MDTGDAEYVYKARILNAAIQEIGMGKYQWCVNCLVNFLRHCSSVLLRRLFVVTGFGYFSYVWVSERLPWSLTLFPLILY